MTDPDEKKTDPGIRPPSRAEVIGLGGPQYHHGRRIDPDIVSRYELVDLLDQERRVVTRLTRALTAIMSHPEHAIAIARVALETVK